MASAILTAFASFAKLWDGHILELKWLRIGCHVSYPYDTKTPCFHLLEVDERPTVWEAFFYFWDVHCVFSTWFQSASLVSDECPFMAMHWVASGNEASSSLLQLFRIFYLALITVDNLCWMLKKFWWSFVLCRNWETVVLQIDLVLGKQIRWQLALLFRLFLLQ